jgi:hypothetical protein
MLVVAETRHIGAAAVGGADDHLALPGRDRHAVDFDVDQIICHGGFRAASGGLRSR